MLLWAKRYSPQLRLEVLDSNIHLPGLLLAEQKKKKSHPFVQHLLSFFALNEALLRSSATSFLCSHYCCTFVKQQQSISALLLQLRTHDLWIVSQADFTKHLAEVTWLCFLQIIDQIKSLLPAEVLALHTVSAHHLMLCWEFSLLSRQETPTRVCVCGGGDLFFTSLVKWIKLPRNQTSGETDSRHGGEKAKPLLVTQIC